MVCINHKWFEKISIQIDSENLVLIFVCQYEKYHNNIQYVQNEWFKNRKYEQFDCVWPGVALNSLLALIE